MIWTAIAVLAVWLAALTWVVFEIARDRRNFIEHFCKADPETARRMAAIHDGEKDENA